MKKIVMIFAVILLVAGLFGCDYRFPAETEATETSTSLEREGDGGTPGAENPQPEDEEDAPEEEETPKEAEIIRDENTPDFTQLRKNAKEGFCAVAFIGYIKSCSPENAKQCLADSGILDKYPSIASIPDERIVNAGGKEVYCLVPVNPDAVLTVLNLNRTADGGREAGASVYAGGPEPIILMCNADDTAADSLVSISCSRGKAEFSPYIKLKDGLAAVTPASESVYLFNMKFGMDGLQDAAESYTNPIGKRIYLTFDDGPSQYTERLLEILDSYNVKATFFVTARGDENLIKSAYLRGHTIGLHTATHNYRKVYASEKAYLADLQSVSDVVFRQTGQRPNLMRFPGGSSNTVSKFNPKIMTKLVSAVSKKGYTYYDWNASVEDAVRHIESAQSVADYAIRGISRNDVTILLQHDTVGLSVEAVDIIIRWGFENGYTFLPILPNSPVVHHRVAN